MSANTSNKRKAFELTWLIALVALSVVLTGTLNGLVGGALSKHAPSLGSLATAAVPSFLAIAGLYAVFGKRSALRWPSLDRLKRTGAIRLAAVWLSIWLASLGLFAALTGHWVTYAQGAAPLLAFLLFGPAGEELLFRGLVFERARQFWTATPKPAILLSTAAFSAHHLWINAAPPGLLLAQVLFTIPMGLVFATLRERSGSLWPGLLLHVATNAPSAF